VSLIPGWVKLVILAALAGLAIWTWNAYTGSLVARGDAAGYARASQEAEARELKAIKEARAEEQRKTAAVQQEVDHAREELAALRGSHDGAVAAGQRLRSQLAAAARRRCPGSSEPATAGGSAPADPAADLYADVQRRLEEAENGTIRFADESRIAGRACERAYQALTPP
jgi:hypothetical protein